MQPSCGARRPGSRPGESCWRRSLSSPACAYLLGLIDRGRLKELNFRLLVGRVAPERLDRVVQGFADSQIRTNIMAGARARLAEDKAAGRRLVLATASYRLYAAAIAQRLGFDDVIATDVEYDRQGRTVARIDGVNCYGLGKLDMIEAWLQKQGLERETLHIRFYSDHISDAPVHHWSDEAFAANAHAPARSSSPSMRAGRCSTGAIGGRLRR